MSRISQGLAGDGSSTAISNITVTYTTDDPGTVADSAITIADGDATVAPAEFVAVVDEFEAKFNEILTVLRAAGICT